MISPFDRLCVCDDTHPYYKNYCYATHISGDQVRVSLEGREGPPVWVNRSQLTLVRDLPQPVTTLLVPTEPRDPFAPRPKPYIALFDPDDEPMSSFGFYDIGDVESSVAADFTVENIGEAPLVLGAWSLLP